MENCTDTGQFGLKMETCMKETSRMESGQAKGRWSTIVQQGQEDWFKLRCLKDNGSGICEMARVV